MNIGKYIREKRQGKGWSMQVLAENAGISSAYVSEIENNRKKSPPKEATLNNIADALSLSKDEKEKLLFLAALEKAPEKIKTYYNNVINKDDINNLMLYAIENNADGIKEEIKNKRPINAKNSKGDSALLYAIIYKNVEASKILLKNGAEPDTENKLGITPLIEAVLNADEQIIKLLLEFDADVNYVGFTNSTVLDILESELAAHSGKEYNKRLKIYDILRNSGGKTSKEISSTAANIPGNIAEPHNYMGYKGNVPVYEGVTAGTGGLVYNEVVDEIPIPETLRNGTGLIGFKVRGDSMIPKIEDGSYILVKEAESLLNGQIGVFLVEEEWFVKKYRRIGNFVILSSLNSNYNDIELDLSGDINFRCLGRVILVQNFI